MSSQILKDMQDAPAACYLLSGDDEFLKDEFIFSVKSLLPAGSAVFNYDVFRAGADSIDEVLSRASTYPLEADFRVVLLQDCRGLNGEEQKKILGFLSHPPGHTLFLLDCGKITPSNAFFKKLLSAGREVKFRVKSRSEVSAWLRERAAAAGKKLSSDAASYLEEAGGDNLRMLANELDKLVLQAGERGEITGEDVSFSAGWAARRNGFELGSAVSRGMCPQALKILNQLLQGAGTAPEIIMGALAWHFRAVWKAGSALREGVAAGKIASVCSLPPFRVQEFIRFARQCPEDRLEEVFRELLQTDINMKTRQSSSLDLELLVVRLCGLHSH